MKRNRLLYCVIAATVAFVVAVSCSGSRNNGAQDGHNDEGHVHPDGSDEIELSETQLNTVGIVLGALSKKELGNVIHASGVLSVDPQHAAEVSPLLPGVVRRLTVVEGQQVSKGQVVAYMENAEIVAMQQDLLTVSEEASLAAEEYDRQSALARQGAGVGKNLSKAKSDYEMANARLAGARRKLQQIGIDPGQVLAENIAIEAPVRSPISGNVSSISASIGSFADMQTPMMSIIDNSAVYCKLNLFEHDADKVSIGQNVDMQMVGQPTVKAVGHIVSVNKAIDTDAKTMSVRVELDDTPSGVVPGMAVTAAINVGAELVDALPEDAVISSGGKHYVFVLEHEAVEDGARMFHFKRVEVIPGVAGLGFTQVRFLSPMDPDASIVTAGAFYLGSMSSEHGEHVH